MRVAGMIALVACGSTPAPGLVGAVGTGAPLTDVELFVGNAQSSGSNGCFGKDGVGPNVGSGNQCFDGSGWTNASPVAQYESATGNVTWFQLMPNGQNVPAVLVVGYSGDTPVEAAVVHDVPVGNTPVQIVMQPVEDLLAQGTGITVWRRPTDSKDTSGHFTQSACAAIGDAQSGVEFFVPADDTDCDGATRDCPGNDFNYCFSGPPRGRGSFSCLAQPNGHGTACRIAGHGCSEDGGACQGSAIDPKACTAIEDFQACVPTQFCEGGVDPNNGSQTVSGCETLDSTCFLPARFANEIHVQCVFAVSVDTNGGLVGCTSLVPETASFTLQTGDAVVGSETCDDAVMYDLTGKFQDTNQLDIATSGIPNASLRANVEISGCGFVVSYEGQGFPIVAVDGQIHGFAALDAHTAANHHRIVPFDIEFTGCASGDVAQCQVVPASGTPLPCP